MQNQCKFKLISYSSSCKHIRNIHNNLNWFCVYNICRMRNLSKLSVGIHLDSDISWGHNTTYSHIELAMGEYASIPMPWQWQRNHGQGLLVPRQCWAALCGSCGLWRRGLPPNKGALLHQSALPESAHLSLWYTFGAWENGSCAARCEI